MKHRFTVPAIVAVLAFVCLTMMYVINSLIGFVLLSGGLMLLLWGYVKFVQRQAAAERKNLLESVQRISAATLGHHRHDWMNDLQVLYGYIQLGKIDKLADCVGRIKVRMEIESKISRLGIPSLVFYLQTFREVNRSVHLDVEIEDDLQLGHLLSPEQGEELTEAVNQIVEHFSIQGVHLGVKFYDLICQFTGIRVK